ncbi:MAG: ArsC family transcriptional regulator [Clostridia bacterium]|nr:ArsC family transcriptional regulator [Clostridia bacterium]MBR2417987.1 ArsC family transcriptional regulator [Clostridia bacterium]
MNIQIYGTAKCFDTKKAQRYFKERSIKFQFVDLAKYGMSKGEYQSIKRALGMKLEDLVNEKSKKYESSFIKYLASEEAKEEKLLENQELFKTPIVRNGKKATLGYCPDEWKKWEEEK